MAASASPSPRPSTAVTPRAGVQMTVVHSPTELMAAIANRTTCHIRLAISGSPYQLSDSLWIRRDVILEGEPGGKRVEIIGRVTLSAGQLRMLSLRPPHPKTLLPAAAAATDGTTVTIDPRNTGDGGRSPVLHDVWIAAPLADMGWSPSDRPKTAGCSGTLKRSGSSPTLHRPISVRPVNHASAVVSGATTTGPLALHVSAGSRGAVVSFCKIRGGVAVFDKAAPLLQSNEISGATGPGILLQGTSLSCEMRDNTIRQCGGSGVLCVGRANGTIADNRIEGSGGAGVEMASGSRPLVLRNTVLDAQGVGLLARDGARGEFRENIVRRAWAYAAEATGRGTEACLRGNQLLDGQSGVGVLVHDLAAATIEENQLAGHQLAGLEVASGSHVVVSKNTISKCGGCGIFIAAGGVGTLCDNAVDGNHLHGIECCSDAEGLVVQGNIVTGHSRGAGAFIHSGGAGRWVGNQIKGNGIGVEVGAGAHPALVQNKVLANFQGGLLLLPDSRTSITNCHIRGNGNGRLVAHVRRGTRTHGDDAGGGFLIQAGATATLEGNQISMNAGPGVFAHADAHATLLKNTFQGNRGDPVASRPGAKTEIAEADTKCTDYRRAVTPALVRRQRVPFDWTVGTNVSAEDKSLEERVAEMRAQYEASGTAGGLAMLPPGADPTSMACAVM